MWPERHPGLRGSRIFSSPDRAWSRAGGFHALLTAKRQPVPVVSVPMAARWHELRASLAPGESWRERDRSEMIRFICRLVGFLALALLCVWVGVYLSVQQFLIASQKRNLNNAVHNIESQFLWSPEIVQILAAKLRQPPRSDFRLVTLLPAHPNNGNDDTRGQLGVLADAAVRGGDEARFLACTLYQPRGAPVYVHAKVAIVDDRWLTVGSANLNEHSLFNDTEMNVVAHDPELARDTRLRLWSEHLEVPADEIPNDPARAVDELWKPISKEQQDRRAAGLPLTHRLVRLEHLSRRSGRVLGPLTGLLVDG